MNSLDAKYEFLSKVTNLEIAQKVFSVKYYGPGVVGLRTNLSKLGIFINVNKNRASYPFILANAEEASTFSFLCRKEINNLVYAIEKSLTKVERAVLL